MSRRNSMLLVGVVAVAAVAAYWMLALTPKREQAAKLSHSISAKQSNLKEAQAQLATYEQARSGYKANYSLVARLGKAVPADDDVRSLLVQVNAAAGKSKVDFRTISVGGGVRPRSGCRREGSHHARGPGAARCDDRRHRRLLADAVHVHLQGLLLQPR